MAHSRAVIPRRRATLHKPPNADLRSAASGTNIARRSYTDALKNRVASEGRQFGHPSSNADQKTKPSLVFNIPEDQFKWLYGCYVVVNGHVFKVRVNEEISGESLYFPGEESRPVRKHKFDAKSGSATSATSLKSRRFSIENQLCFTHHNEQQERESNLIGNLTGGKRAGDGLPQASTPKTLLGDVDLLGTRDLQDEIDRESIGKKQKATDRVAIDREESSSEQGTVASNSSGGELQPASKSAEVLMASTQERDDEGV
ncbi:hypothetical protein Ancab_033137 [Ancistrocladus abbreviatus]